MIKNIRHTILHKTEHRQNGMSIYALKRVKKKYEMKRL